MLHAIAEKFGENALVAWDRDGMSEQFVSWHESHDVSVVSWMHFAPSSRRATGLDENGKEYGVPNAMGCVHNWDKRNIRVPSSEYRLLLVADEADPLGCRWFAG